MALNNLAGAEEALSLSQTERADLARLLIESLADDPRGDEEIKAELTRRLNELVSGADPGLGFQVYFLGIVHERRHPNFLKTQLRRRKPD